jgi:8-oxo-dGTP pyrophosphatase MutT (NUDIX family)
MPSLQQAVEPRELAKLLRRFGPAPHHHHPLAVDHPFLTGTNQQLASPGRRAEICYVMHQGDPGEGVLLHRKRFYPAGAYRLPTGGIHWEEEVESTLAREIREETGLEVGADAPAVQVERFLGLLSYDLVHRGDGRTYPFATYHFLVRARPGVVLTPQDPVEEIDGWQWRPAAELGQVAGSLENVYRQTPDWGDWGRFRALSHIFVVEQLAR